MNKLKIFFLLMLLVLCNLAFPSSDTFAWERTISDCPTCGSRSDAVEVDTAGDILTIGSFFYGGDVVKLSGATGEVMWRCNVSGYESRTYAQDLAIDSNGDVFVVFVWSRVVVKVSGTNGTKIWEKPLGGTINALQPIINAVVVDGEDNVITGGTMGGRFNVGKLNGRTGDEIWHYDTREGIAESVAVDSLGNIAAAGKMNANFATVKLQGNGVELWQKEINGNGGWTDIFETANAVAIDSDGSVVAVGITSNNNSTPQVSEVGNFRDFTVAKYLPNGDRQWIEIINGRYILRNDLGELYNQSNDIGNAVALDREGNVIAAGSIQESIHVPVPDGSNAPEHFQVVKIARNGGIVWSKSAQEPPFNQENIYGQAFALSVNAYGNIVASGTHGGSFTLVKFWGSTGGRAWRYSSASSNVGSNIAHDVVMDSASDVIAVGQMTALNGWEKFTVVKLRREDGKDYSVSPTIPVPEIVRKYAPVVYLYSEDVYRPGDPMSFTRSSELKWSHQAQNLIIPCDDHTDIFRGMIITNKLGAAAQSPYSHMPKVHSNISCSHRTDIEELKTNEYTRPFDGSKRNNVLGQEQDYMKEGFYLDPDDDNELRYGIPAGSSVFPGAPVFYEYVERRYITYWFFYPYDKFEIIPSALAQEHEGDWERVSVQLNGDNEPSYIFYYSHKDGRREPWNLVEFDGTHPVVYSAKGSHGSYPAARDDYPTELPGFPDHTNRGPKWNTWNNLLKVESQPWYGFGGAWGEVGELPRIDFPLINRLTGSDWTGPLGPSTYKSSSMPTVAGQNITVATNGVSLNFSNVSMMGYTVAVAFPQNQLPPLPAGYFLPANTPIYEITSSAVYSGSVEISFDVSNIAGAAICNRLRVLHYTNNAWNTSNNVAPSYNIESQVCTVRQVVTSLSPFVVAQLIEPTAASVAVGGRVLVGKGNGIIGARVYLTDQNGTTRTALTNPFGYYRFEEVPAGQTYIFNVQHKRYQFNSQVLNVTEEMNDLNFVALPESK